MKRYNVEGSWPALVTPFTEGGEVNYDVLRNLVDYHVENGSNGLLLLGSTAEGFLLTKDEKTKIIDTVIDAASGRIPVMCGVSAVSTRDTLENAERAGVNIEAETIARLARHENIVALKEAGPNPYGLLRVVELTRGEFNVLCCDCPFYALVLPVMASGGKGTSNVSGSVVPREFASMSKPWEGYEDSLKTRELYFRLFPLMRMMYAETNPVPLKAALNMMGADVGKPRKPLTELSRGNMGTLKLTLERLGVLDEGSYQMEFFSRK
jgi:4-hydroxy-tetrahydrodipicolinate synthase